MGRIALEAKRTSLRKHDWEEPTQLRVNLLAQRKRIGIQVRIEIQSLIICQEWYRAGT